MSSPELYACMHVKEFAAQALLRLRPELRQKPCVVMEGEPPLQQVCSMNTKARRLGVLIGMTQVEMETFPAVTLLPRSLQEETATKTALLECAESFTPRVEEASTETALLCVLDIAGTEKLFGDAATLAEKLKSRAKAWDYRVSRGEPEFSCGDLPCTWNVFQHFDHSSSIWGRKRCSGSASGLCASAF